MANTQKTLNSKTTSAITSRVLNAPRNIVFKAWTDPQYLTQWWGPDGFTSTFHEHNAKAGGDWKFILHGPNGVDYPNEMVYVEVSDERIVLNHTSQHHFLLTATFEDAGEGKTKLTWVQRFETVEEFEKVKPIVTPANEQNIDRLETVLRHLTEEQNQ